MLDPRLEDFDKDAFMASLKESMGMCAEEKLLYQKIDESTESVVPIYDQVCDFLFQDVSFAQIEPFIPDWIVNPTFHVHLDGELFLRRNAARRGGLPRIFADSVAKCRVVKT